MQNYNYSNLDYLTVVRKLIDDVVWTTIDEKYISEGQSVVESSQFFDQLFDGDLYDIEGTDSTFHNEDLANFLRKYTTTSRVSYKEALKLNQVEGKQIILQLGLHPRTASPHLIKQDFFDKFFKNHKEMIPLMREGRLVLLFFFGWEADNFANNPYSKDVTDTYYKMFDKVVYEYGIPYESMVILNSNKKGYEQEIEYYGEDLNHGEYTRVIYENAFEINAFQSQKGEWNPKYTFDEHISNLEKGCKRLLRINRTQLGCRDFMLYWLENTGYIKDSIVEHRLGDPSFAIEGPNMFYKEKSTIMDGDDSPITEDFFSLKSYIWRCFKISKNLKFDYLLPGLNFNEEVIDRIKKNSPYIASEFEKESDFRNLKLGEGRYSNETIPVDVYYNSIFSWASTSLTDRFDQVFINASTFNPILHYHPIVFNSNPSHQHYMIWDGFKPYNWFTESEMPDCAQTKEERMTLNLNEIHQLMNKPKDTLIGIIKDNRESLEHNRKLLFECKSIENIIKKLYVIINEKYMNSDGSFDELKSKPNKNYLL